MVALSEIRLGNWFQYDGTDRNPIDPKYPGHSTYYNRKTRKLDLVFKFDFQEENWLNQVECVLDMKDVYPIELTVDLCKELGLLDQVTVKNSFYRLYETEFYSDNYEKQWFGFELSRNNEGLGEVKYLHQYQNLFFALTGEELSINL